MLTPEQLADLERLARAATPGPWIKRGVSLVEAKTGELSRASIAEVFHAAEDGDFIAAANPAMALWLVARIAELEQDLVGAFVRIGELEYEVEAASEAPPIMGAADLVAGNRYWARHGPDMKWALIDVSNVEGIEYGMKNWQFVGPVIPPAA
ncbi:hypothetical protein ACUXVY_20585 [Chromobacterium haemolyticum]|uniref:hypothetical protein n=1 Tax=Chromobacterium haemolyticum TaxID=394935 RepID=UPI00405682F5